jgi:hypothetical protein
MKSARKILVIALLLAPVAVLAQGTLVQTADPALRGLKESDFPRLQQLEPNVYAYEELRPSDPGKFKTTVDMIVVTSGGVLVADGQGNLAATQKLVAAGLGGWARRIRTVFEPVSARPRADFPEIPHN